MRSYFFKLLFWSGLGPLLIFYKKLQRQIPIFLFHRVNPEWDIFTEPLSPKAFEKIILFLKKFYTLAAVSDMIGQSKNTNMALVHFDDATKDFMLFAYPILKKHDVPFALFLPFNPINSRNTIWNYTLFDTILNHKETIVKLRYENIKFCMDKESSYFYQQVMQLHKHLLTSPQEKIFDFLDSIVDRDKKGNFAPLCSWEDLNKLNGSSYATIGSHTCNHTYLPAQSEYFVHEELADSKRQIEEQLGVSVDLIAYPNGGYNQKICQIASKYYDFGFSVDEQFVQLKRLHQAEGRMQIPRFNVQDSCPEEMILRAFGFHKRLTFIKNWVE